MIGKIPSRPCRGRPRGAAISTTPLRMPVLARRQWCLMIMTSSCIQKFSRPLALTRSPDHERHRALFDRDGRDLCCSLHHLARGPDGLFRAPRGRADHRRRVARARRARCGGARVLQPALHAAGGAGAERDRLVGRHAVRDARRHRTGPARCHETPKRKRGHRGVRARHAAGVRCRRRPPADSPAGLDWPQGASLAVRRGRGHGLCRHGTPHSCTAHGKDGDPADCTRPARPALCEPR